MDIVLDVVCGHYRTTKDALLGKGRTKNIAKARTTAYWLARHAGLSFPEIARAMLRDHSTVLTSVKRLELQAWESSRLMKELDRRLGLLEGSETVVVAFNKRTLTVLQELLESGLWGDTLEQVVERVTCQYLHEQLKRED